MKRFCILIVCIKNWMQIRCNHQATGKLPEWLLVSIWALLFHLDIYSLHVIWITLAWKPFNSDLNWMFNFRILVWHLNSLFWSLVLYFVLWVFLTSILWLMNSLFFHICFIECCESYFKNLCTVFKMGCLPSRSEKFVIEHLPPTPECWWEKTT